MRVLRAKSWWIVGAAAVAAALVLFSLLLRSSRPPPPSMESRAELPIRTLEPPPAEDPTRIDHVASEGPRRPFTPEQLERLDQIRREYGELESQRLIAEREGNLARTQSLGLPHIAPLHETFLTACRDYDRAVRELPGRAEAEARKAAADRRAAETAARAEAFQAHLDRHWQAGVVDEANCEWCRRDAERMRTKDPQLGPQYAREQRELFGAAQAAEIQARTAAMHLAALLRSAHTAETTRASFERMAAARRALDEALVGVPEVARLKDEAAKAAARQTALMEEFRAIHREAPLVGAPLAGSGAATDASRVP